jgi:hypothetical protein
MTKITIETDKETITYKDVTDYYLDVRWVENKIVLKSDGRSSGELLYLIGRLYTAIIQLKDLWRKNK